jgi:putative sterol carrier protein
MTDAQAGTESLGRLDAEQLAALVRNARDGQLREAMESDGRDAILEEVMGRMAEHLDPDRSKGVQAVLHWKIWDRPGGGYDHYEVVIEDGRCEIFENPSREPRVTLKLKPVTFLKLVSGNASGPALFLTGKLKIDGDVMFASRLTSLFRIPKAPG